MMASREGSAAASPLERLLGPQLVLASACCSEPAPTPSDSEADESSSVCVSSLCGPGRVVGLYFASGQCPACKAFLPHLTAFYHRVRARGGEHSLQLVLVSSDTHCQDFTQHCAGMPWLALPFHKPDLKARVTRRLRAQGIPTLVLVDSTTALPITRTGRDHVMDDPEGTSFPWRPRPLASLLSGKLLAPEGAKFTPEDLRGAFKGIYFSAHWCPPCRAFTPQLATTFHKVHEKGMNFQIIFVSSDRSSESFHQYWSTMPWPAIPWEDEARRKELAALFGVHGIPTLVLLDPDDRIITLDARVAVTDDLDGHDFPWWPRPVEELTERTASRLREGPCVLLFVESEEDEVEFAEAALLPVAEEYRRQHGDDSEDDIGLRFFIAGDSEVSDSLHSFLQLPAEVPLLTLLDFPANKYHVHEGNEVSAEIIRTFVQGFIDGTLESRDVPR